MKVKIFWQPDCPNCPPAKELGKNLEEKKIYVEYKNIKEPEGLADAAYYGVMSTPSVIICGEDDSEIKIWLASTPKIKDVLEVIK